ncbi:hypothetical protein MMC09_002569 [Bachmanniomyces sp. S44760]|nr:hypothetical protein [Bachmanniomyces sp. S44760]
MYARGILFGKMKYELGDHSFVRCPETGLAADIEFKTKGYFGGTYNAIGGIIKNEKTGENLYELSGMWSGDMMIKNILTGKKELLFDATNAKHSQPLARPLEEQNERESQKLWYKTVLALKDRNHEVATDEKTKIEDMQREEASQRQAQGVDWHPALFRRVRGGPGGSEEGEEDLDWILNADIDAPTPEGKAQQIFAIHPILPGQKAGPGIPARGQESEKQRHPSGGNVPPAHQSQAPPPSSDLDDLIDFGQEAPPSSNPAAPAAHQSTHLQQPGAGQSIDRLPSPGAPPGLQHPLQPIQRQDTNTQEVDTFVDADDGGKGLL